MTEFNPITEFDSIEDTEFMPGSLGRVAQNTELKIIDLITGQSLGPNIDGEICVRGPKMFSGYHNNEIATKEAIDSEGWLHTGDIGHYDQNERIFITDRLKELIKYETSSVSPTEIECFLLSHESVSDVVVVGVKHETQSQWPRAYVKLKEGKNVTEEELERFVAETLSDRSRLLNSVHSSNILKHYFILVYGMTEYMPITEFPIIGNNEFMPGSVGYVSQNTELKIIDLATGQSLGPNIDGEICVRGPKMFSGYLNNEIAIKETIDSEGWFHTGDIGHYDQNERIFITDRLKELIRFETASVSPAEIECFLLNHESVSDVAVVGVKHETQSQWPRAYVKLKEGKSVTEEELERFVAETLSDKSRLRAGVVFVDNIPRIGVGKIDRKYFKQLVNNEIIKNIK